MFFCQDSRIVIYQYQKISSVLNKNIFSTVKKMFYNEEIKNPHNIAIQGMMLFYVFVPGCLLGCPWK